MVLFHRDLMSERERAAARREIGVALARSPEWPESAAKAIPLLEAAAVGTAGRRDSLGVQGGRPGPARPVRRGHGCLPDGPGGEPEPGNHPGSARRPALIARAGTMTPLPTGAA